MEKIFFVLYLFIDRVFIDQLSVIELMNLLDRFDILRSFDMGVLYGQVMRFLGVRFVFFGSKSKF